MSAKSRSIALASLFTFMLVPAAAQSPKEEFLADRVPFCSLVEFKGTIWMVMRVYDDRVLLANQQVGTLTMKFHDPDFVGLTIKRYGWYLPEGREEWRCPTLVPK